MSEKNVDYNLRYARQIGVAEIGKEGQKKINEAKVLVVGCGALGSMVAMQLAGAGVGTIGIIDFDTIDLSNLQRQFFYNVEETGKEKVKVLSNKINDLNPTIVVNCYSGLLNTKMAASVFGEYDFILDCTDNPESKKIIGEMASKFMKPCCIGGINNFVGQIVTLLPEEDRFEEYFGNVSGEGVLPCSLGGVFGPAAAVCASIQASETLKFITGAGDLLSNKLLTFNLLSNSFNLFTY